ncbi:MAG: 4-alpha-glucanotransferase [Pseudomonadota bacterium]
MSASAALKAKAAKAGILLEPRWSGAPDVPTETLEALCELLGERPPSPAPPAETEQAFVPQAVDERRRFGVALQLYQLRSERNFGVGDLGDLHPLIRHFAAEGADFIGLNPLHALFTAAPERASPFSPSDRRFLNPLIIAVEEITGAAGVDRQSLSIPDSAEKVDYTAAATAKLAALKRAHTDWQTASSPAEQSDFNSFVKEGGEALGDFALFEALSHHMVSDGHGAGWTDWPAAFRAKDAAEVASFAESHSAEIEFQLFLQFIAAKQLARAQAEAREAGMAIGLYLDLAVGTAPDGAATWADPTLAMAGVRVGAPPDFFSAEGQDWGLAPLSPTILAARGFAPYRDVLSAVLGPAGAARIDHAMGLERLYLIPEGTTALSGAYVSYDGLTDCLISATHDHQSLAIGEDLGVVPEGFRERMGARRIFAMRILPFERDGALMRAPAAYPRDALACLSTHDLAPLAAWWAGLEIDTRVAVAGLSPADARAAHAARRGEKELILSLAGLPPGRAADPLGDDLVLFIHRIVARSASRLVAVRLEDVVGGTRLVNLPGTDREHPNWRHTLPLTVGEIIASERLSRVFQIMREERG